MPARSTALTCFSARSTHMWQGRPSSTRLQPSKAITSTGVTAAPLGFQFSEHGRSPKLLQIAVVSAVGGSLGQLSRGQSVPEFEELVFRLGEGELAGRLLETRFGLHIVQVLRKVEGQLLPYETVKSEIAAFLDRQSSQRAIHQYLHILVGQAVIEGMVLEGADSPLVQ